MRTCLMLVMSCCVGLGGLAHAVEGAAGDMRLAQNTGPVDRGAAGNGSMGMGDGIKYLPPRRDAEFRRDDPADERPAVKTSVSEPGHGGNETDMEHRHRPTLGDKRKD